MPVIKFSKVEKTYASPAGPVPALKGIDLEIAKGEIFGIIGLSGAGKSTLVRCINMLERPTGGKVIVDGQDMTALSDSELREARKDIGMIFQHFNLLSSATVYENIAFPLKLAGKSDSEIKEKVEALFKICFSGKTHYFAAQKGSLMAVNLNEEMYQQTINYMVANHPCLSSDELPETAAQKNRREKNISRIKAMNVVTADKLMSRWDDEQIVLRDKEAICKRAVCCFFVIQIACDIANDAYDELMYKAQVEPDPAARFGYFHEAESMLKEDLPFLPLYYYTASFLADSENYEGYFNYLSFPMFRYVHAK